LSQPHVQRLLLDPRNAEARAAASTLQGAGAARGAVEPHTASPTKPLSPFAKQAGPDADVVSAREARSSNGRRSSRAGKRSELTVIDAYHAAALLRGVARMTKLHTPYQHVGHANRPEVPGAFAATYSERSTVDCWGYTLAGTPRTILEEIKGVTEVERGGRFAALELVRVQEHQREELLRGHDAGHIAIITAVFGLAPAERVFVVPAVWALGRTQVRMEELREAGFGVRPETYLMAQVKAALR
jgi:hypothetical protein